MMQISRARGALAGLAATVFLLASASPAIADTTLADAPLFSTVSVPGNLLLALSVEFPTTNTAAYPSTPAYSTGSTYIGYFDAAKCYTYNVVDVATTSGTTTTHAYNTSYFVPSGAASSTHTCTSTWSGNWLNWASMQTLDEFRWVLTGGNRTVDSTTQTVLQKTYHSGQASSGNTAQNKSIGSTLISGATPLPTTGSGSWSAVNTRTAGTGYMMLISNTSGASALNLSTSIPSTSDYTVYSGGAFNSGNVYGLYMNVQVCASAALKEDNCVLYGTNYKPEGLMQAYSSKLRYAAMGYLNDPYVATSTAQRDGGVLRAAMKYVGPTQPVPGSTATTNSFTEWSSSTGIMGANPNPADATATNTAAGSALSAAAAISQSGVMNYLNKFGYASGKGKYYDPVSELYYAAIRYYKNQGNVAAYSDLSAGTTTTMPIWLDGFPVISTWTDPILYSCQKNFILGIGDTNTNTDSNLPGHTLNLSNEPSIPAAVSADTPVPTGLTMTNVSTATNMTGTLEGSGVTSNTKNGNGTFYIGGLAYDAHTNGVRVYPDGAGNTTVATVSTYWLDVLEGQTYANPNQYYYATKYGGFTLPDGVWPAGTVSATKTLTTLSPYASTNAKDTLSTVTGTTNGSLSLAISSSTNTLWHTNSDRCSGSSLCGSTVTSGDYRPDNYFTANNANAMKTGLTAAFAKISSEAGAANSTAIATPSVNVTTSGAVSYGATYDPTNWTGTVAASTIAFAADGTPTTTAKWDARLLLSASTVTATSRKIVTCCTTAAAPGLAFTDAALTAATLISRTNYPSFGAVPGVSSESRSNFLSYLRGDKTQEAAPNGTGVYRDRAYRLGDIVNAKPVAVEAPSGAFFDTTNPGYSTFKTTYASRKTVVYVGANDGMLHAFDGSVGASASGQEIFAYVPSFVYGNGTSTTSGTTSTATTTATTGLAMLGDPTFTHYYYVDSTPAQFDADLNNTSGATSTTPNWRTLLIGGLGKGGNGYYALDVTVADTYNSTTTPVTEASIASQAVLWEFTDTHMGYTYGTPTVVKTKKYGWVVVMTSGYNNDNGIGYFYFVNPRTGALLERVATPSGSTASPINMAQHTAYVPDYTDGSADAIYGVDLQGDVWRLDVTTTTGTYAAPTLIATLKDGGGNAQPITTRPLIEPDPSSSARYVLVGTGRLLADTDIASATSNPQSFYAIIDGTTTSGGFNTAATLPSGVTFPIVRSELNAVTDLTVGIAAATAGKIGWYFDMPVSTSGSAYIAQRVNVDPVTTQGVVAWAGNLPNGSACSPAGTGTTYSTAFSTGKTVLVNSTGAFIGSITNSAGVITEQSFLSVSGTTRLYSGDSSGAISLNSTKIGSTSGVKQLNWRDVPLAN